MDRLTTLLTQFHLSVGSTEVTKANLVVLQDGQGVAVRLCYYTKGTVPAHEVDRVLWAGYVDWSGRVNPFLVALPKVATYDLVENPEAQGLVEIICNEAKGKRCGAQSVVNRLAEVLIVRMLRHQLEHGATEPGLLAGLADPRINRAVVAIHDRPGQSWDNASLAQEAGLSLSRFSELFSATVGETPMGYLRRWRLILAQQDLQRGARVDAVARRYAYASGEAFSRAFRRAYGVSPMAVRKGETVASV